MVIRLAEDTAKLCKRTPTGKPVLMKVPCSLIACPRSKIAKKNKSSQPENGDPTGSTLNMKNSNTYYCSRQLEIVTSMLVVS